MTLEQLMINLDLTYDAFMILDTFFVGYCVHISGVYNEDL